MFQTRTLLPTLVLLGGLSLPLLATPAARAGLIPNKVTVAQDGSSYRVTAAPEALSAVREAIEQAGMEVDSAELTMVPKTTVSLEDESAARKTLRLIDALEESDDVQEVYSNFDIPERVMEAVAT